MNRCNIQFLFFPVGQGLFSAGRLATQGYAPFVWVYDCGTLSDQRLINVAIDGFSLWHSGSIGLVVLSHFDKDHISGICKLIKNRKIKYLMLPYVAFSLRISIALNNKLRPGDDGWDFFVDPAAYFLGNGYDIEKIIFVLPANNKLTSEGDVPGVGRNNNDEYLTYIQEDKPLGEFGKSPTSVDDSRIVWVKSGSPIKYKSIWEFIPYNEEVVQKNKISGEIIDDFIKLKSNRSFNRLKKMYDMAYGNGSRQRNIISLFLYVGPIYRHIFTPPIYAETFSFHFNKKAEIVLFPSHYWQIYFHGWIDDEKYGWLSTGDGYLNNKNKLSRLIRKIGAERMDNILCFQVMHHGARKNWHKGLSKSIKPYFSIFSSDPRSRRNRHPHMDVWNDFAKYRPIQVDGKCGFTVRVDYLHL